MCNVRKQKMLLVHKFLILHLFLGLFLGQLYAQQFLPASYDFGTIKEWRNPTAKMVFVNNSSKPVMFLPISYNPEIEVIVPEGYINPGESKTVEIIYYTRENGRFTANVPIYVNTLAEPIYVTLKGKILSFHKDALMRCPSMNERRENKVVETDNVLSLYNEENGKPLAGCNIVLTSPLGRYVIEKNKNPKVQLKNIPVGIYNISAGRQSFETKTIEIYLGTNGQTIPIPLKPINGEEIANVNENNPIEENATDQIIPVQEETTTEQEDIERLREKFNKEFEGKTIIEKDVMVINEKEQGNISVEREELERDETAEDVTQENRIVRIDENAILEKEEQANNLNEITNDSALENKEEPLSEKEQDKEEIAAIEDSNESEEPPSDFKENGSLNSSKYLSNNIVFLIDVSGSMDKDQKLERLKRSMIKLVNVLRDEDRVTIITYATTVVIEQQPISAKYKEIVVQTIENLEAGGKSRGEEGLNIAYELAQTNFIENGNNIVFLASDGLFNSKNFKESRVFKKARKMASKENIKLSAVAFGTNSKALAFLSELSSNGQGGYIHIQADMLHENALLEEIMKQSLKR